jgi:hypothetical protein
MVDTLVLGTSDESFVGSSPTWGTLKKTFDKYETFRILEIIIETMRTIIEHMSSFKQQVICSWYRHVRNYGSEIKIG